MFKVERHKAEAEPQAYSAPTGRLRFFRRVFPDGEVSRILQQEFAVISLPAKTRSFEWHDVPMVEEQVLS